MASGLWVAAGSIDITPHEPVPLAGFTGRTGSFTRVADTLELNALLLQQDETCALLLSADVLFVGDEVEAALRRRLEDAGLVDCLVLAAASHTHFAPAVDTQKPALGVADEQFRDSYIRAAINLADRLLDEPPTSARIRYAEGVAAHSVNRRRLGWRLASGLPRRTALMRANPAGPNDQSLHVLRIEDEENTTRAVVWCYACHPVSFPHTHEVTAEFPGVVRAQLRASLEADTPVLFLQGFSGNLRPPAIVAPGRNPARRLAQLVEGPDIGSFSEPKYWCWAGSLAELVAGIASSPASRVISTELRHQTRMMPLSTLVEGPAGDLQLTMTQLELSKDLQLFAINAEVVVEYVDRLRQLFPRVRTIPVGCAGSVFGYLPTDRMLDEGGYEAAGFFQWCAIPGRFRPVIEGRVVDLMKEFAH